MPEWKNFTLKKLLQTHAWRTEIGIVTFNNPSSWPVHFQINQHSQEKDQNHEKLHNLLSITLFLQNQFEDNINSKLGQTEYIPHKQCEYPINGQWLQKP